VTNYDLGGVISVGVSLPEGFRLQSFIQLAQGSQAESVNEQPARDQNLSPTVARLASETMAWIPKTSCRRPTTTTPQHCKNDNLQPSTMVAPLLSTQVKEKHNPKQWPLSKS